MLDDEILGLAESLLSAARTGGMKLVTAESCTGGLIAGALTAIAGSSDVVDRGFVTYSNEAKAEMLGVPADLIHQHGAVSEQVARAMAYGALLNSLAEASVAVTGIAGPGGGTADKPVGLVYIAAARRRNSVVRVRREVFPGDRTAVRRATVLSAFDLLQSLLD
jgi:nicotinamide-nucleotide amidase